MIFFFYKTTEQIQYEFLIMLALSGQTKSIDFIATTELYHDIPNMIFLQQVMMDVNMKNIQTGVEAKQEQEKNERKSQKWILESLVDSFCEME